MAQIITKNGTEEEYKVDDKNMDTSSSDADKNYTKYLKTNGEYTGSNTKTAVYPQQVVEYSVSSSSKQDYN